MNDTTKNLYEHLKNRLYIGYGYGDDGQVIVDKVPDHAVFNQSLREDHQGDVGVFEYLIDKQPSYDKIASHTLWKSNVQISVVCKDGDIDTAKMFLIKSFKNFVEDDLSSDIYIDGIRLINILPSGKNKDGNQMIIMNIQVLYYIRDPEEFSD